MRSSLATMPARKTEEDLSWFEFALVLRDAMQQGEPFDLAILDMHMPGMDGAMLAKAIREGVRPDKSVIGPPMPIESYRHMADDDLAAVIAYLRTRTAVKNTVPRSTYRIPVPTSYGPPVGKVKAPAPRDKLAYGKYLVEIGHCMECHTPVNEKGELLVAKLGAGGQVIEGPWGKTVSRNLTPTGLKDWTDAQIAKAIRSGVDRNGQPYRPPMAYEFYKNINDADIAAIIAYLRSLKPQPTGGTG